MTAPRVFISMGTPYTPEYAHFRDGLENLLRDRCGADPRIIGKNEYPSGNPLSKIREVMASCHGVVVVAYERKFLEAGVEKRGGEAAQPIHKRTYTTPWNHIESAMAFSLGLPLYIICQHGLAEEGLIESKLDWYVQYADISSKGLERPDIAESLRAWVNSRVMERTKAPRLRQAFQGMLRISEMTPKEIAALFFAFSSVFGLGVAAGKLLPKWFGG